MECREAPAASTVGVAGVTVNFAPPAGGRVGSASVTTNQAGQAASSLTLGGALGAQSFAAVALGFSVAIPATAIALGLAATFNRNDPLTGRVLLVGTFWILPLAYFIRDTPLVSSAVRGSQA